MSSPQQSPMPLDSQRIDSEGSLLIRAGAQASDDQHLKAKLASLFASDANDFLWRADLANDSDFQHRSWLGKIYVDYYMAVECALKSVIIYLSSDVESPQSAYKVARTASHNLQQLFCEAERRAQNAVQFVMGECSDFLSNLPFSVVARYDLELLHAHSSTKRGYDSKINDFIRNRDFMQKLRMYAFQVRDFAHLAERQGRNRNLPILASRISTIQDAFTKFKL